VDVLNRCGIDAAVLHQQPGFRCDWFANTTRVEYLPDVRLTGMDFLVIPEIYGPNIISLGELPGIGRHVKKVIFNQNCRYTFLGQSFESIRKPGFDLPYNQHEEFIGAIVVSEDSRAYLQYVFPDLEIWRIHNAINTGEFRFSADKKRQICFMPRKHADDALQVLAILRLRNTMQDFDVVAIENRNETEVAGIMAESAFFLSFGYPEGCPLPPAEAMASGCLVVGYDGFGGREYFDRRFSYPVDVGDITGYAQTLESLIEEYRHNPAGLRNQARQASEFITSNYSPEKEQQDIVRIWTKILGI